MPAVQFTMPFLRSLACHVLRVLPQRATLTRCRDKTRSTLPTAVEHIHYYRYSSALPANRRPAANITPACRGVPNT